MKFGVNFLSGGPRAGAARGRGCPRSAGMRTGADAVPRDAPLPVLPGNPLPVLVEVDNAPPGSTLELRLALPRGIGANPRVDDAGGEAEIPGLRRRPRRVARVPGGRQGPGVPPRDRRPPGPAPALGPAAGRQRRRARLDDPRSHTSTTSRPRGCASSTSRTSRSSGAGRPSTSRRKGSPGGGDQVRRVLPRRAPGRQASRGRPSRSRPAR